MPSRGRDGAAPGGPGSPAERTHPHLLAHTGRTGPSRLHPVAELLRLVEFAEELRPAPPARSFTLLRVRRVLPRVGQVARVARTPALLHLLPVGQSTHHPKGLGSYAPTFPPNRCLMPVHACEEWPFGPVTVEPMRIHVVDHPLVAHKLTTLRDKRTDSPTFRRLADELVTLLAYEATRDVRTEQVDIETPVTATTGVKLSHPRPLVVPILRAGLGMLDGMVRLLPTAEVGFLGMIRNEETLQAETYATRMPEDLSGRQVYVLDPMLATGGTLVAAIQELIKRGADDVTAVVLLAAPEGVEVMERELAGTPVTVVTASVDERLDESGYIVPGLGDAGDRMYGTAE